MSFEVKLGIVFENLEQANQPHYSSFGSVFMRNYIRGCGEVEVTLHGLRGAWIVYRVESRDLLRVQLDVGNRYGRHGFGPGPLFRSAREAVTYVVEKISEVHGRAWARSVSYTLDNSDYEDSSFSSEDFAWLQNLTYHPDMGQALETNPLNVLTDAFVHFARAECPHWRVSETMLVRDTASGRWRVAVKELGSEINGPTERSPEAALARAIRHLVSCRTSRGAMTEHDRVVVGRVEEATRTR